MTVKELIEELKKQPQDAIVAADIQIDYDEYYGEHIGEIEFVVNPTKFGEGIVILSYTRENEDE